jgi:hypothetical protein
VVDILGVILEVDADADVVESLHPFGLPAPEAAPVATLRVTRNGDPVAVPARPPDATEEELAVWWTDGGLALADAAGVTASVTRNMATIDATGSAARAAALVEYVVAGVLTNLLARHQRYVLHAALVVGRRGAVAITGTTGAGKSTAALAAIAAGLDVRGDDMAIVHGSSGAYTVTALPQLLHLPGDLGPLPEGAEPFSGDPRQRWTLPVDAAPPVPLLGTVLLAHSPGAASLEPATGPDVVAAVLAAFSSWRDPGLRPAVFDLAVDLARLPVRHRLAHDIDPARRVAAAGALLASLVT